MTYSKIKLASILILAILLAGCTGNQNNREIIFINLTEDANAGFFRNGNELTRILLDGIETGALVPYQIDYFGNGEKTEISLDSLNKVYAIPYADDLAPDEIFSPYVSDLFLIGLDRIFNATNSGISHLNLYYSPEVMPDGTRQYIASIEYPSALSYLEGRSELWYSNSLINPDNLTTMINPDAAEFYSLAEALAHSKYQPSERREISKDGKLIISGERDKSAIPATPTVTASNFTTSSFVVRATQSVNLTQQPEMITNNFHGLAKALLLPALKGELAAYKSDSLQEVLDPASLNANMLMPPTGDEETSSDQYPIVEIALARFIYNIEFTAAGSETVISPVGISLVIPGDLMPDGTNHPVAYFRYQDVKQLLAQLEIISGVEAVTNYDAAINANKFTGPIILHWDVREILKPETL